MFKLMTAVMMLSASLAFAGGDLSTVRGSGTASTASKAAPRKKSAPPPAEKTSAPSAEPEKTADTK